MKIIFMGTPSFAAPTLKALISAKHNIVAVYSRAPKPAGRGHRKQLSLIHQLSLENDLVVETPIALRKPEAQERFASYQPDIAIIAAYGLILPPEILSIPKYGCINIHPSLLPRWRGAAPIQRAILAGDKETAVCIMQMDAGLDTGDIIKCEKFTLSEGITAGVWHDIAADMGARMVIETLRELPTVATIKQSNENITYANKLSKGEASIDWNKSSEEIERLIRGLNPSPAAHFNLGNERIKVFSAISNKENSNIIPGTIINDQLNIACGSGILKPQVIQRAGKKPMNVEEFLRGNLVEPGTILRF